MTPVEPLRLNPAGSPVAEKVYGELPPVAETLWLNAAPTAPFMSLALMLSVSMIRIVKSRVAV